MWKAEWYFIYFKKSLKYLQSITSSADMSNSRNSIFNCFAFLHLRILDLLIHTLNENLGLLFRVNIFCWSGGTNAREILVQLIEKKLSPGYREVPGRDRKEERFLTKIAFAGWVMVDFDYEKCNQNMSIIYSGSFFSRAFLIVCFLCSFEMFLTNNPVKGVKNDTKLPWTR